MTIGGDDTLSYSQVLVNEGVPLVAIPKTMDNDVQGTEYCIGFSTAITRAKEAINRQRTTLGSHERIGVFRIFGRDAGFSALFTAYVTSARCVIPEAPYDLDALAALLAWRSRREPEPLRVRDHGRGRDLEGRADGRASAAPTPSATGTRPTSARRSRSSFGSGPASRRSRRSSPTTSAAASRIRSIRWSRRHSPTSRWTSSRVASPGGWWRSRTASTPTRRFPTRRSGRGKVDVPLLYNAARFRPRYDGKLGEPMLLVGLD